MQPMRPRPRSSHTALSRSHLHRPHAPRPSAPAMRAKASAIFGAVYRNKRCANRRGTLRGYLLAESPWRTATGAGTISRANSTRKFARNFQQCAGMLLAYSRNGAWIRGGAHGLVSLSLSQAAESISVQAMISLLQSVGVVCTGQRDQTARSDLARGQRGAASPTGGGPRRPARSPRCTARAERQAPGQRRG